MNRVVLEDKLKQIKIEDFIWIVYIGIIFLSFYANSLEAKFYLNMDEEAKNKYQKIMIGIFSVLIIVYGYFLKSSMDDLKNLNNCSDKKRMLLISAFIASLLIFVSGIIYLSIALVDNDLDVELAFN